MNAFRALKGAILEDVGHQEATVTNRNHRVDPIDPECNFHNGKLFGVLPFCRFVYSCPGCRCLVSNDQEYCICGCDLRAVAAHCIVGQEEERERRTKPSS